MTFLRVWPFTMVHHGSPPLIFTSLTSLTSLARSRGLGTELRSFALHFARLEESLETVCAVTLFLGPEDDLSFCLDEHKSERIRKNSNTTILGCWKKWVNPCYLDRISLLFGRKKTHTRFGRLEKRRGKFVKVPGWQGGILQVAKEAYRVMTSY